MRKNGHLDVPADVEIHEDISADCAARVFERELTTRNDQVGHRLDPHFR